MNRHEKEQVVQILKNELQASEASFLVGYKGLSVARMADLRKKLRARGGDLRVAKVTLLKKAAQQVPDAESLIPLFADQIAIVFAKNESPVVAKVLCDFFQDTPVAVVGGCYGSSLLDARAVKRFSMLPSREMLLAQVAGTLKAPLTELAYCFKALLKKREETPQQQGEEVSISS